MISTVNVQRKLISLLSSERFKKISSFHITLLNDLASSSFDKSSPSSTTFEDFQVPVWLPHDRLVIVHEIILVFVQLFLTIILPLERCFMKT